MDVTANSCGKYAKQNNAAYYQQFKPLIEKAELPTFQEQNLGPAAEAPLGVPSATALNAAPEFDEHRSDRCMMELMGTGGAARCHVSTACTQLMTQQGVQGYSLTHQVSRIPWLQHTSYPNGRDPLSTSYLAVTVDRFIGALDAVGGALWLQRCHGAPLCRAHGRPVPRRTHERSDAPAK